MMEQDHFGMTMGDNSTMEMGGLCKMSMLWNWDTVDTCLISEQWHIQSGGAYAASLIAIFFLVLLIETTRRVSREYDRRIIKQWEETMAQGIPELAGTDGKPITFKPSVNHQLIRSAFYMALFGSGYMLMLLAMTYNGGIILTIFVAAFVGHFFTAWDTVGSVIPPGERGQSCC